MCVLAVAEEDPFLAEPTEADNARSIGLIGLGMVASAGVVCFITDLPTYYETFLLLKDTFSGVVYYLVRIRKT